MAGRHPVRTSPTPSLAPTAERRPHERRTPGAKALQRTWIAYPATLIDRGGLGVAREVWIEEHLRAAKRRRVERALPTKPSAAGDVLRNVVEIKPGKTARVGYIVQYER
jgi:hypothetical protein